MPVACRRAPPDNPTRTCPPVVPHLSRQGRLDLCVARHTAGCWPGRSAVWGSAASRLAGVRRRFWCLGRQGVKGRVRAGLGSSRVSEAGIAGSAGDLAGAGFGPSKGGARIGSTGRWDHAVIALAQTWGSAALCHAVPHAGCLRRPAVCGAPRSGIPRRSNHLLGRPCARFPGFGRRLGRFYPGRGLAPAYNPNRQQPSRQPDRSAASGGTGRGSDRQARQHPRHAETASSIPEEMKGDARV